MNTWEKSLIGGLIVAIIGIVSFQFIDWHGRTEEKCRQERQEERQQWEQVVAELEANVPVQEEVSAVDPTSPPEETAVGTIEEPADLFDNGMAMLAEEEPPTCADLAAWLDGYFNYLDEQDHVRALNLEGGSTAYYNTLMKKISAKPPLVTELVLNFDVILQNIIHFYRVLGETNIEEAKQLIEQEEENMEAVLSILYAYATKCDKQEASEIFIPPLAVRYEYAGFLLNTIGGRSYLYRRDSRTRILLTYYAVLTLHETNKEVLNQYGIDIVPYLEPLADEIAARNDLALKEKYIATLNDLSVTYAAARAWGAGE